MDNLDHLLTLLNDALFALENIGVEEDLCERIREVLREEHPPDHVTPYYDEIPY